jgi:5-methyltetrahydropteroyltriglutamate--homocysteine methyltransferase
MVVDQCACGIDIPTDGEAPREHYIYYHLRHLDGVDFWTLTGKTMRNGSWTGRVPTVVGPIRPRAPFLPEDWRPAQLATDRSVKMTVPGPMTIVDSIADSFYGDPKKLGFALADALNAELLRLADAGCRHLQVDEPLFARKPAHAIDWGFEALERCFHALPPEVTRTAHVCCGYPSTVDGPDDYPKADRLAYFDLAKAFDLSSVHVVSIEDAHRRNDLSLLELFTRTSVILGVIDIARTRIETVDEIRSRLSEALEHIDAERLIAGPDCGLTFLDRDVTMKKLRNLSQAAHSLGAENVNEIGFVSSRGRGASIPRTS